MDVSEILKFSADSGLPCPMCGQVGPMHKHAIIGVGALLDPMIRLGFLTGKLDRRGRHKFTNSKRKIKVYRESDAKVIASFNNTVDDDRIGWFIVLETGI